MSDWQDAFYEAMGNGQSELSGAHVKVEDLASAAGVLGLDTLRRDLVVVQLAISKAQKAFSDAATDFSKHVEQRPDQKGAGDGSN